jgi:hypothetical protein
MTLKARIHAELDANTRRGMHTPWLTVEQLVKQIPQAKGRYETVARALRQLRFEGRVKSRPLKTSGRFREWTVTNGKNNPGQPVVPATPAPVLSTPAPFKGRSYMMCRPTNMPTFVKATEDVVRDFVQSERAFSAYDVTTTLREQANDGKVTIDSAETGTVHVGGKDVAKVTHDTVKGIVHEMFHTGEMTGYTRAHNGSYWQYEMSDDDADDSTDDSDDSDDSSDDDGNIAVFAVTTSSDDDSNDKDDDGYDGSPTL